jgi:hypothetical protein
MNTIAPFFIVGCSRSGTTLLQALLDAHPRLAIPPESHIYNRFGDIFHTYGDFAVSANRCRFIQDMLQDAYIQRWELKASAAEIDSTVTTPTRAGIVRAMFENYARSKNAARWGDKTPEHIRHLETIRHDFPDVRLIHLIRDGRDTAEAMRRMIWTPVTAVGLGREWSREVTYWLDFCERFGTENTLVVRFEDMMTDPSQVLGRILEFLGESFVDTSLTYRDSHLSQSLGQRAKVHSSLLKDMDTSKIGIYRKKFTPREIEIIESSAGEALSRYGYSRDFLQPRPATRWEQMLSPWKDRLTRWYRKLFMPEAFVWDLQFRLRKLHRKLIGSSSQ